MIQTKDNWYFWPSYPSYWCYSFETLHRHCTHPSGAIGRTTITLLCWQHPCWWQLELHHPRDVVSKFDWNWPSSYETTLHDSSLRNCFLQWPQNTLLCSPSAMPPPNPTDPITALTVMIMKLLSNQPLISLVTPSFDWNTMEQYDDFQLFHKSVESWFTFQNIPAETPADLTVEANSTWLENVLNFLGNTGCTKFDCWKPTSTADEIVRKKKQATVFMDYLSSMMDHAVSQCCRIYQLKDICIWPVESPDELVDCLWALADWCNFPTQEEKEWNIQYIFIRALSDKELIKKLLALDLTATTTKMLEVCCTFIAISDNLKAMGLKEQKTIIAIWRKTKPCQGKKPPADSVHSCWNSTKSLPPGRSSCPAMDNHCWGCGKLEHWKPKCWSGQKGPKVKGPKDKGPKHHNRGGKQRKVNEVGTDEDPPL